MKTINHAILLLLFFFIVPIEDLVGQDQKGKWYLHPSAFFFDLETVSSTTSIAGGELPGENVSFSNSLVPGVSIGYFVHSNISIHTVIAFPPTSTAKGINALEGSTAADVTYAPFALTGLYHFDLNAFRPFIGGGLAYAAILKEEDRDVTNVAADNALGFILRGGFEYFLNENWGIAFSANKLYVDTDITGNVNTEVGPAPATVEVSLNPWVYSLGLAYILK